MFCWLASYFFLILFSSRKLVDVAVALKQSFEAVVMTQLFPRSQIDIYVQVLQADGSTTAASINATTLAMIDAGIPMRDYLCGAWRLFCPISY